MTERNISEAEVENSIDVRHIQISELFPNHDLTEVMNEYKHLSNEALVNFICERLQQIPKKPDFYTRLLIKAYTFATGLANRWPSWFGGRLFNRVICIATVENDVIGVKEKMECSVCWECATVAELCFCDSTIAINKDSNSSKSHCFCQRCLEQHALAAIEEMPLAKGGLGLRCMVNDCENPINFHEISAFLPEELAKKLEERCAELSITQAQLNYMERCRKCNCAVELGNSPNQMQVFVCPECKFECCRLCDEAWNEEHRGITCEEFSKRQNHERLIEKRLSEVIVRNCPKCKLAFVKSEGCNKITCKCGYTQCYICRAHNISYEHFCTCPHAKKRNVDGTYKCSKCNCTCLLWESAVLMEQHQMEKIRSNEAKKKAVNKDDNKSKKQQKGEKS